MGARLAKIFALAALVLAATASSGAAASPVSGRPAGIVPHSAPSAQLKAPGLAHAIGTTGAAATSPTPLTFDGAYQTVINQYFTDVAADSGGVDNVYGVDTQYWDGSVSSKVFIQYSSTFGGSYVDNNPLPANGCNDGVDAFCVNDSQLHTEIQKVLTAKGWHGGLDHMFFLMTPNGVGSCFDAITGECSTNVYCAYHSYFVDSSNEQVIYANEPDEGGPSGGCTDPRQGYPNDPEADVTVNTISHEHNEAITDPLTDNATLAWIANDGSEIGDLCAYDFDDLPLGGIQGSTAYNQLINGHQYDLQPEYSNLGHTGNKGCLLEPGGTPTTTTFGTGPLSWQGGPVMHTNTTYAIYWLPTAGNTSRPVVSGTAAVNHTLTTTMGGWSGSPSSFAVQWQRCSSSGTSCADIAGATANTYNLTAADGGMTVRSTVRATNVNGQSQPAPSAVTSVIAVQPASTALPVISGITAVGKTLSTSDGTWNTAVTYAYQWLRCSSNGSGCAAIPGATAAQYTLAPADGGHKLKSQVTGTNIVGSTVAVSQLSSLVVTTPKAKKAPHVSGHARVGKKLSGSTGSWTGPPTSYRYQWLRCNARGGGCSSIGGATLSKYKLTKHDAGHKLRLRVKALNAAGSKTATSAATARVRH
jgi:hypothetical protein